MRAVSSILSSSLLLLAPPAAGQGVFHRHDGAPSAYLGSSLAPLGDVDLDGKDDYVVGEGYGGVVRVHSGATGAVIHTLSEPAGAASFGWSVGRAGDVDQDGRPDFAVGAPGDFGPTVLGRVDVHSGATGALIRTYVADAVDESFGAVAREVGDLNQDGVVDLIVGVPADYPGATAGRARVYSGIDGALLLTVTGQQAGDAFGLDAAGLGDLDQDGFDDFVVGAPFQAGAGVDAGRATLFSGQTGAVIRQHDGLFAGQQLGGRVSIAPDVDPDGVAEYLVSGYAAFPALPWSGEVRMYSGVTGALVRAFYGDAPYDAFGSSIASIGDMDGDGVGELALAGSPTDMPSGYAHDGYVRVVRATDGVTLHRYDVPGAGYWDFAAEVAPAGDVNGDGYADLLIGGRLASVAGTDAGAALAVWLRHDSCGSFVPYGEACVGSNDSAPSLTLSGCARPGGFVTLSIENGPAGGAALLFVGTGAASLPLGNGCGWYLNPTLLAIGPLPLGGPGADAGGFGLTVMNPLSTAAGTLTLQALVVDAGAPLGYVTTNAVKETIDP